MEVRRKHRPDVQQPQIQRRRNKPCQKGEHDGVQRAGDLVAAPRHQKNKAQAEDRENGENPSEQLLPSILSPSWAKCSTQRYCVSRESNVL